MTFFFSRIFPIVFLYSRRDREEGLKPDDDGDDETMKKGFVPIGQAVKNAEVRTTAATANTTNINGET